MRTEPSGADFAVNCAATMPFVPGRFSTTTFERSASESFGAISREMKSGPAPGTLAITMRTCFGICGASWAMAANGKAASAASIDQSRNAFIFSMLDQVIRGVALLQQYVLEKCECHERIGAAVAVDLHRGVAVGGAELKIPGAEAVGAVIAGESLQKVVQVEHVAARAPGEVVHEIAHAAA